MIEHEVDSQQLSLAGKIYVVAQDKDLLASLQRVHYEDERVGEHDIGIIWHELRPLRTIRQMSLQLRQRRGHRSNDSDFAQSILPRSVWQRYDMCLVPAIVFLGIAGEHHDLPEKIHDMREVLPGCIFVLYGTDKDWRRCQARLSREWSERLRHYYFLKKPRNRGLIGTSSLRDKDVRRMLDVVRPVAISHAQVPEGDGPIIFVSYSHKDIGVAAELEYRLHFEGYSVWMDVHSIAAGDDWDADIQLGLEQSSLLILALSSEALESKHVQREYEYYHVHNKPIIPLIVEHGTLPPQNLSHIQFIDMTQTDFEIAFQHLTAAINRYLPLPG